VNAGKPLPRDQTLFDTGKFTQEKGLTNAVNMGKSSCGNRHWFCTGEFTLQKSYKSTVCMGTLANTSYFCALQNWQ
jgi:hypothetical protein